MVVKVSSSPRSLQEPDPLQESAGCTITLPLTLYVYKATPCPSCYIRIFPFKESPRSPTSLLFLSWRCPSVPLARLCSELCLGQAPGAARQSRAPVQSHSSVRHLGCVQATNSKRASVDCGHEMPSPTLPSEQRQVPVTSRSPRLRDHGEG